jgi:hypothetical protein
MKVGRAMKLAAWCVYLFPGINRHGVARYLAIMRGKSPERGSGAVRGAFHAVDRAISAGLVCGDCAEHHGKLYLTPIGKLELSI